MLKFLSAALAVVLLLLKNFLKPPPKKAREVLTEESETSKAQADAEAKATEKFGPRP